MSVKLLAKKNNGLPLFGFKPMLLTILRLLVRCVRRHLIKTYLTACDYSIFCCAVQYTTGNGDLTSCIFCLMILYIWTDGHNIHCYIVISYCSFLFVIFLSVGWFIYYSYYFFYFDLFCVKGLRRFLLGCVCLFVYLFIRSFVRSFVY